MTDQEQVKLKSEITQLLADRDIVNAEAKRLYDEEGKKRPSCKVFAYIEEAERLDRLAKKRIAMFWPGYKPLPYHDADEDES